jgi:anti-sigma B factor antagonist
MFHFDRTQCDGIAVLTLQGTLDASTSMGLKAEVVALAEAQQTRVVVDLAQLTLIDSTGVGVLISLFKRTRAQGGLVLFAGLTGQPKEIFRLLRLDSSNDLTSSRDEALAKLRG